MNERREMIRRRLRGGLVLAENGEISDVVKVGWKGVMAAGWMIVQV